MAELVDAAIDLVVTVVGRACALEQRAKILRAAEDLVLVPGYQQVVTDLDGHVASGASQGEGQAEVEETQWWSVNASRCHGACDTRGTAGEGVVRAPCELTAHSRAVITKSGF
ncbi:MAG: hypothetical protein IAG13_09460 [Deltaproteobacteria bacterium]|nr:hypothetical protein [Nannocystaceae bacterium]